jgi:hypothetical protein
MLSKKYEINFKCGHKEEMEISEKARPEQRIQGLEKHTVCFSCYRKENARKRREEV